MANVKEVYESASEAAEVIGTKQQIVSGWIKSGRLQAVRVPRAGRPSYRIRHVDLIAASRGTMFEDRIAQPQLSAFDTLEDARDAALSLEVIWPYEHDVTKFTTDILAGFETFRALTYTVSLPSILKLLTMQEYREAEILFGSEGLVRETSAEKVVLFQQAIEDELARGYLGIGGATDEQTAHLMAWQATGRARFYVTGGGIVHSKLYFLEKPGLRRVLVGSANLSDRAMSGRQGEVLLAFDNDDWMWGCLMRKYEAALSLATGLQLRPETKPAHLVKAEDLPAGREAKRKGEHFTLFFSGTDMPGDPEYIAVRAADLETAMSEGLRENIHVLPEGKAILDEAALRPINYALASKRPATPARWHSLSRISDHFIYDGRSVEVAGSNEGIASDALLINQFIDKFHEFGKGADLLQRNYFGLMGWLYFTPFMPALARDIYLAGGNASKEIKHVAIVYGQSHCGKSALVRFLLTSMFGPPTVLDNSDFTQTDFKDAARHVGVLPLFYQDVAAERFSGRNQKQGELIIKLYDVMVSNGGHYPCTIVTLNPDATEFANEVRNRAFLVYTPKGLPSDDEDTRRRLDKETLPFINRLGQDFYLEYLDRMTETIASVKDPASFDYLLESTSLIRTLLVENLIGDEVIAAWAKPVTASDFNGWAWELKHQQMASRLVRERYTRKAVPTQGYWTATDTDILIGVDNVRDILRMREVQDHWVNRTATYGSGNVLVLDRDAVVDSIRRTDPAWNLPAPRFPRVAELFRRI